MKGFQSQNFINQTLLTIGQDEQHFENLVDRFESYESYVVYLILIIAPKYAHCRHYCI